MPRFKNIHTGEVREVGGNAMLEFVQAPNWEMLPEPPAPKLNAKKAVDLAKEQIGQPYKPLGESKK